MKVKFILDVRELLHVPLLTMFNYFLEEGFLEALSTGVAFDIMSREVLWQVLVGLGVKGCF